MRTLLSGWLVLLAGCGGASVVGAPAGGRGAPLAGAPVAVTPIPTVGVGLRPDAPARLVVRSADAFAQAWARFHAGQLQPPPPLPAVDFAREMVLVAALGTRPSGGFAVAIPRAALDGAVLRAEVVETRPGAGCVTTAVVTSPVTMVRVARHDGAVEFVDRVEVNDCG